MTLPLAAGLNDHGMNNSPAAHHRRDPPGRRWRGGGVTGVDREVVGVLIGEPAEATGTTARALRHYEQAGLINSQRAANRYRVYEERTVVRVRNIRHLPAAGLTSDDVRLFLPCLDGDVGAAPYPERGLRIARERPAVLEARIAARTEARHRPATALRNLSGGPALRAEPPVRQRGQGLMLLTTSAVAVMPSWMVGAMLVPARKNPRRAQTRACESFSPPLRRKITARISRSSTSEIEMAMANLLRRAGIAAFGVSLA